MLSAAAAPTLNATACVTFRVCAMATVMFWWPSTPSSWLSLMRVSRLPVTVSVWLPSMADSSSCFTASDWFPCTSRERSFSTRRCS